MIKRILSSKTRLGIAIIVILMLVISLSYGTFLIGTDNYKVSELLIAELNYGITITKDDTSTCTINGTQVTTPVDSGCFITIQISSVNPIDSRYALTYKNEAGNAEVKYTDKTQWTSEGLIDGYTKDTTYTRKVRVVIDNIGKNSESITDFKVFGGYTFNSNLSIKLKDNYQTIPGIYTESEEAGNQRLVDIVEKDTDCVTSNSNECLYGGGVVTNYLQYPTPADGNTNDNLWRITGSYELDGTTYAKVVYNTNQATTASTNIKSTLDGFYSNLDKASDVIFNTDKFNCTKSGCTASNFSKMGLLSTYEYNTIGGQESYLRIADSWFALESGSGNIKNITPSGITEVSGESGIRPTAYLQTDVTVTGKGTIDDPYRISPKGDINIAYTLNGKSTTETYKTLLSSKIVNKVTCQNGSKATWDYIKNAAVIEEMNLPDYCTIDFKNESFFITQLLKDNKVVGTRTDFSKVFEPTTEQPSGLYVENNNKYLENDGRTRNQVYYFVGNPENNWVKFGKEGTDDIWWRIIRTNEDGSVRLLYVGKNDGDTLGHARTNSYIKYMNYISSDYNSKYVGYMYGETIDTYEEKRMPSKSSPIKETIDKWYLENLASDYGNYLSKTAVYCNDRATGKYVSPGVIDFAARTRLIINGNYRPSYKCGNDENGELFKGTGAADVADRFTVPNDNNVGNEALTYPIALITADEIVYAGGKHGFDNKNAYYSNNSLGTKVTGSNRWWTMSPSVFNNAGEAYVYTINDSYGNGRLDADVVSYSGGVRPVVSLKSCVSVTGSGTTDDPYIPSIDDACAAADN